MSGRKGRRGARGRSISWTGAYRLSLRLLPTGLRRKHGLAMEDLFAREVGRALEHGRLHAVRAGVAGVWDVVIRSTYERLRSRREAGVERHDRGTLNEWSNDMHHQPAVAGAYPGGQPMEDSREPQPTTWQLLRRHAVSFAIAFAALTASLLALFAARRVPALGAQDVPTGTIAEVLLLAIPFNAAMTIPMAVLVAVLAEFVRLGEDGTLAAARRDSGGVRRLIVPVLAAAAGMAALAFVVTAEIVPRANERLTTVLTGEPARPSDRSMTIGELREAARNVGPGTGPAVVARAAAYEVEVQKKLALPAACIVMALLGVAVALRVPRGGKGLVIIASCTVFGTYYMMLVAGEGLADRLVVSPAVGMWGANALLMAVALLAMRKRDSSVPSNDGGALVLGE